MSINRSDFYKWRNRKVSPAPSIARRDEAAKLFKEYHAKYPSHGYRWLNAKIRLDIGAVYSDNYAHKICKYLGIKSESRHYKRYGKKVGRELKRFPNYILADLNPTRPFDVVVSDMTAFWCNRKYYELTLFMDLFNNEIISYALSDKRGDPKTYHTGLNDLLHKKEEYTTLEMILHSDQGSVYSSKKFNESLHMYSITHSMSKPGRPQENGAMESINGWIKEELFIDLRLNEKQDIFRQIDDYIIYFNTQRPQCALNYLTPKEFKERNL